MHYNLHYEVTKEVSRIVTLSLLRLYENHKDDERIFPNNELKEIEDKQED
ncbi:hypothetical protein [Clostridium sp. SM-530-WT-3G]|mgnify:CR=1 FL=1|nr:hypothetical protein [Clostridium sp. SM-530-WT-3G]NME83988.1 hypothetical protein [Clostridium sp. SM-530-WT-3G]